MFDAIKPLDPAQAVFGQYDGYRHEPGVAFGLERRDVRRVFSATDARAAGELVCVRQDGEPSRQIAVSMTPPL